MPNNKLKITGGALNSRLLTFFNDDNLKPTKSYIRQSLFNVINIDNNMICLDLFCGSGILSAEAISRGVKKSILIENNLNICNQLQNQFKKLDIQNYELHKMDVIKYLKCSDSKDYDLIFIDAPFQGNLLQSTIQVLDDLGYLKKNSYLYFEQNRKDYNQKLVSIISKTHNIIKDLSIGDVSYTIAQKRDI
ncbi:MAG: hypothetical protein CBE17_00820 [Gammaproteobacteria bacterium TMED257]|nr:MAG: hypothetical protein CBE17_00820 [Gammaproteobacteria bacterium TMED257]